MQRAAGTVEAKSGHPHALKTSGTSETPILPKDVTQFGTGDFTIIMDMWSDSAGNTHAFNNGAINIYPDYLSAQDGGDRYNHFTYPSGRWATYGCT